MPCRLCLNNDNENIQLFSVFENVNDHLPGLIKSYISIEIIENDNLPITVCLECIERIKDWHEFRENCLKVNEILLSNSQTQSCDKIENDSKHDLVKTQDITKNYNNSNNEIIDLYVCTICSSEFRNCFEYLDHQIIHNGEEVFKCDKCSEVFSSREELVEHDSNHKIACPRCGKMVMKSSLKLHLIKHTDKHVCTQCKHSFNSKAALDQHNITLHTNRKDHICKTCGKRFASKTSMTVHLKTHSDQRSYKCTICEYSAKTASAIYIHMSTHANEICICEICSKTFKSTRNLNDHLRRVHSKEKKYSCQYCDKKFVDKYMLTVHVRCHTGVRPYACKLCDKAFIRSDGLKEHMVVHGQRKWFDCLQCQRRFASKKGINRHQCINIQ